MTFEGREITTKLAREPGRIDVKLDGVEIGSVYHNLDGYRLSQGHWAEVFTSFKVALYILVRTAERTVQPR